MDQRVMQEQSPRDIVRTFVRSSYDLQKLRIQMGNRITGNFKAKLGMVPGTSEKELEAQEKKVLQMLRKSYARITDGIVAAKGEGKLPTLKKFQGDELITTYAELLLVEQYMSLLRNEEAHFKRLGVLLEDIPVYRSFLSGVNGIGPAMAGVLISEIDITKAEYPSSLWAYAGLDAVQVGYYTDDKGVEHTVPMWKIDAYYEDNDPEKPMLAEGKYVVTIGSVGRSRKDFCLVDRPYINKEGQEATRKSITYNPFLKTKLMGVLATSFLRSGTATVDGTKMGAAKRLDLAKSLGYDAETDEGDVGVDDFLRSKGKVVIVEPNEYAKVYYDYKQRLENNPRHKEKTPRHRHFMALRYAVKRFLVRLYQEWRAIEGLPIASEYSEGKLGMVHGQAK